MTDSNSASQLDATPIVKESTSRLPGSTYLLLICQGINLTAAVVSVSAAAVVGVKLAPSSALGTIPYGAQFAAVTLATYPAASFMRRYGRRSGFSIGAVSLIIAGILGYEAVATSQYMLLILAHAFLGTYVAFANYYRFAAVDNIGESMRSRAMSLVVSGGVAAAFVGPVIAVGLRDVPGFVPFSLCYASLAGLGALSLLLIVLWNGGKRVVASADGDAPAIARESISRARTHERQVLILAIISAAVGYFIMNVLMVQALLSMNHMGVTFETSSFALNSHVLAMFVPSFITGLLISRFGTSRIIMIGYGMLAAAGLFGLLPGGMATMTIGLMLLGMGWNLAYVGGGILLSNNSSARIQHKWQGINDTAVAICATVGATVPSLLENTIGWVNTNLSVLLVSIVILSVFTRVCRDELRA